MVYKIIGDFNSENFEKIINKLAKCFKILYKNETLYVSLIGIDLFPKIEDCEKMIRHVCTPQKSFLVTKINANNIKKEPKEVAEWLTNNYIELEKQLYAKKEQEKLQKLWKELDNFESEMDEKIKNGEIKPLNLTGENKND